MFITPIIQRIPSWPRLVPWLLAFLVALPVGWMAAQTAAATRNIAYWY
jgi:hypothetical protein